MSIAVRSAQEIIATCIVQGITHVVYCPGSRNAPFAYALHQAQSQGLVHVSVMVDERSAGFFAVGIARGGGFPLVVTTSGTAVAELHPALEEARHQFLPLVAITADRPAHLIDSGASQTTVQSGMFTGTVVAEIVIPDGSSGRDSVIRSLAAAKLKHGPVHINVALEEPLSPDEEMPWPQYQKVQVYPDHPFGVEWSRVVEPDLDTVVVAGDAADRDVVAAAQAARIPIVAEPTAPGQGQHAPWIASHLASGVQQVVVTGKPTLSRSVQSLIAQAPRVIVVASHLPWANPSGNLDVVVSSLRGVAPPAREQWVYLWRDASLTAEKLMPSTELNVITAAREIWSSHPDIPLWLGASQTVRAFDAAAWGSRSNVHSNRGLAGIDGTISSALGLAHAQNSPIQVVLGDLSFVYDMNVLSARPTAAADVRVIVFNDGGGSIFASLEHGKADAQLYDQFFAVAQECDIVSVAQACGWSALRIRDLPHLQRVLSDPIRGRQVVEVPLPWPRQLLENLSSDIQMALRKVSD